ncbi:hypothetical protein ABKA04_008572 [Annulohypoxylon sp. FPYF3050]
MNSTLNHYQGTASIIQENQVIEPSQINLRGVQNSTKRQRSTSLSIPTSPTTKRPKSSKQTTKSVEQILPLSSETFERSARQRLSSLPKNHTVPTVIRSPPSTSADTAETLPTKPQPATPPEALLELPTKLQPTTCVREPSAEPVKETQPVTPAEPPAVPLALIAEHPPPPAQEQHPSTAIDSAELLSEEETTKRQSRHINDWIAKCHNADQESVRSNNMSEMSLADSTQSPPSELLSANIYENRISLPDDPRYRIFNLPKLGIELIKPSTSRMTPEWVDKLTESFAVSREDESISKTMSFVRKSHSDIMEAKTADYIEEYNLIYEKVFAGLQLQARSGWTDVLVKENVRYGQNTLIQNPTNPKALMAIPKPAITVGYSNSSLKDVDIPYTSNSEHIFTINTKATLYTPFLLVETNMDSTGYATNVVYSLILNDTYAEFIATAAAPLGAGAGTTATVLSANTSAGAVTHWETATVAITVRRPAAGIHVRGTIS